MAIIYSYPSKGSVASGDLFVISDASDNNKTKQVTAQDIANFVDGEVTLQEVLNTGNRAGNAGGNISTVILQDSTPTTTITLDGPTGEITTTGNISADGTLGVAGLSTLATVDINGGNIDDTVIGSVGPTNSFFTNMTADTVNIDGGTIDSTLIGSIFASEAKFATQGTNSAVQVVGNSAGAAALRVFQGPIQFGNTGGVGYGNVGDVIISNGLAGTPEWIAQGDLSVARIIEDVQFASAVIKGTAVYISGPAHGSGRPTVDIADADGASNKMPVVGLALQDYAAGQGQVIVTGILDDINLTTHGSFNVSDVLYIKDQGGSPLNTNLQNTKPTGDAKIQNIGIIAKPGANGSIQVSCIGRTNDLPNNDANALFSANASGFSVSTIGKLEVDIANDTISIGDSANTTDITLNSDKFIAEVKDDVTAGVENLTIGYQSFEQAKINGGTARSNVAIGVRAMQGTFGTGIAASGSYNVAVGNDTLNSNSNLFANVTGNTAIGHQALQGGPTNIADYNTAVGYQSLINLAGVAVGTADNNTAIGAFALFNATSGGENTSIGVGSGQAISSGIQNTFLGHNSGTTVGILNNATAVGQNADVQADGGTALGQDTIASAPGSIALGKGAVAANPNTININVANINGVQPSGGLFVTNAVAPPVGLTPGDVYVLDAGAPSNGTGHNLLCIMP